MASIVGRVRGLFSRGTPRVNIILDTDNTVREAISRVDSLTEEVIEQRAFLRHSSALATELLEAINGRVEAAREELKLMSGS
jgi:hypothetical protein